MRLIILFVGFILGLAQLSYSQNINISIFSKIKTSSLTFVATSGKYDLISNNRISYTLAQGDSIEINVYKNTKLKVTCGGKNVGKFKHILLRGNRQTNYFTIHRNDTLQQKVFSYDNDLNIETKDTLLSLVNDVNYEKYIAGVVEAEGGPNAPIEYFKTQAILCRTYSMMHHERHLSEGYNLCDDVHCQAYRGRCKYNMEILRAAEETAGLVIVDKNQNIISATFYANSGGQTVNSEDVWVSAMPYLRAVPDKYSLNQPGFRWTKTIDRSEWENYLQRKGFKIPEGKKNYTFRQPTRVTMYEYAGQKLALKTIRTDWQLRSTFFSIEDKNDGKLILNGKGYGHGVGLSQEGAMEMARQKFTFDQIIHFYYKDVDIMSIKALTFFKEE